jgi:hypothetical protein
VGGRTVWGDLHATLSKKLGEVGGANVKTMSLGKEANSWAITFTRNGTHTFAWNNVPAGLAELLRSRSDAVVCFSIFYKGWHEFQLTTFHTGHCFEPLEPRTLLRSLSRWKLPVQFAKGLAQRRA